MVNQKKIQDIVIAAILLVVCFFVVYTASSMEKTSGHFPYLIACAAGILLIIQILMGIKDSAGEKKQTSENVDKKGSMRLIKAVLGAFSYALAVNYIGYYVSTVIYLCGTIYLFGYRDIKKILFTGIGTVLFIYILFVQVLMINLPTGILF